MYVSIHVQGKDITYLFKDLKDTIDKFETENEECVINKIILSGDFNNYKYYEANLNSMISQFEQNKFELFNRINKSAIDHIMIFMLQYGSAESKAASEI